MNNRIVLKLLLPLLLIAMLFILTGCDSLVRGGTEVVLEGVSMGTLSMEGKPVQGLPTGKIDLVIKVPTNRVTITSTEDGMIVRLSPSEAVITKGASGLSITGVEPDEIEMRWQSTE
jgi:outer membrane lipopolysaccharide assembly protein LptE/RlpB